MLFEGFLSIYYNERSRPPFLKIASPSGKGLGGTPHFLGTAVSEIFDMETHMNILYFIETFNV